MAKIKRLLILLDPGRGFDRAVIEGVVQRARSLGMGTLLRQHLPPREDVSDLDLAAIITSVQDARAERRLRRLGVPAVNVSTWQAKVSLPSVTVDNEAIGRMGARYLMDRAFTIFAFYASHETLFAHARAEAFAAALAAAGHDCQRFHAPADVPWQEEVNMLASWLQGLPRPTAIMADNDDAGRHVVEVLRRLDVAVPEQAAVLGVDNDAIVCETATPPLSSIDTGAHRIGEQAVAVALHLAESGFSEATVQRVEPRGVVTRRSTDVVAVADEMVARALHYIQEHASKPIDVMDVLEHVPMSRRSLERRFTEALGRSPSQQIRRAHVERAAWLLAFTDWELKRIAFESGFRSFRHFAAVFREDMGMAPTAYRRSLRA